MVAARRIMTNQAAILLLAAFTLLIQGGHARNRVELKLSSYGGGTRAKQLTQALTCMTALKRKLTQNGPQGQPPPLANPGNVANCLRYSFHDCGTFDINGAEGTPGGCNGGIRYTIASLITAGTFNTPQASTPQHNGLDSCQNTLVGSNGISGICQDVRTQTAGCSNMPFADCISFTGILAVASKAATPATGCPWVPGRVDYNAVQNPSLLPSDRLMGQQTIDNFKKYGMQVDKFGLTQERTVALLLGAHTIGRSRQTAEDDCSKGLGRLSATAEVFNNEYYQGLVNNVAQVNVQSGGWFCTDMGAICNAVTYGRRRLGQNSLRQASCAGRTDSPLYSHMKALADGGNPAFFSGFCNAYQAMSLIGYNYPATYAADAAKFQALLTPFTLPPPPPPPGHH